MPNPVSPNAFIPNALTVSGAGSECIFVRYNGFPSRWFTAINVQLDAGRKCFLGWSIDVGRDWAKFRFDARRHGFAAINIQLDTGRNSSARIGRVRERGLGDVRGHGA